MLREQDSNLRPSDYEPDELPTAPSRDIVRWYEIQTNIDISPLIVFIRTCIFIAHCGG